MLVRLWVSPRVMALENRVDDQTVLMRSSYTDESRNLPELVTADRRRNTFPQCAAPGAVFAILTD